MLVTADTWQSVNRAPSATNLELPTRELEYQFLVEHMDGGLILADSKLVIHEASSAAALLVQRSKDDLVGRRLNDVLPQGVTGSAIADLGHVLRTGEQTQFDLPHGAPGTGRLRIRAFPWLEGIALILRVYYEGDEEARLAEHEALEKAREAHGAIQVLRLSVRATVNMVDAAFAQITGLNRERILGIRFADLLDIKDRARARDACERVLGGQSEAEVLDVLLLANEGDKLPVRIAITPLAEGFAIGGAMLIITFEQQDD